MCGRRARWWTRSVIGPAPPVDQLIITGERAFVAAHPRGRVLDDVRDVTSFVFG